MRREPSNALPSLKFLYGTISVETTPNALHGTQLTGEQRTVFRPVVDEETRTSFTVNKCESIEYDDMSFASRRWGDGPSVQLQPLHIEERHHSRDIRPQSSSSSVARTILTFSVLLRI
ncbi:hypothetical protein BESB_024270 [Besnoitia besnoiti]|uniref:Uncharacterized protein n=1 Tax=Besnoitia besnoiti TaxID=94643 RepID=A0A2A9M1S0_BESBE|nr:hypothetical protein BESB_024270 [Besnoitia besnoiti]PFH31935.1 hypothetical protein BESB_024270 [Besnoitia besnoiti]